MKKVNTIEWAVSDETGYVTIHDSKEEAVEECKRCRKSFEGKFRVVRVLIKEIES